MAAWTPPSFHYYREADGTVTILDEKGNTVPSPPTMKHIGANGDAKMLDPWGNEVPEYVPTYPDGFFIHTFSDGSMTAVDASGVPLPIQPELGHGGPEMLAESDYAVLPDGTMYEAPAYEFPDGFFIHTFSDGSMTAVDASGVPLPIQPELGHGGPEMLAESDYAVLPDGTMYEAPAYEFPDGFFIHTFSDGSMTAVDASGVPLPIQPELGHGGPEMLAESDYAVLPDGTMYEAPAYEFPDGFFIHTFSDGSMTAVDASGVPLPIQPELGHGGPEMLAESDYAVLPDGTMYEAPAYEFPDGFFIHTFSDGSMTAVDASGVPLPIQPELGHGGPEMLAESDYAVLPDGTVYIPPPLYPPDGEPPEEWPPPDWETEVEGASTDTADESDDPDTLEVAADQGPESGSADPADPFGTDDGGEDDLQTPIEAESPGEEAVEEVVVGGRVDDTRGVAESPVEESLDRADATRVVAESPVEESLERADSDLLTAGLVETPPEQSAPTTADASIVSDMVSNDPILMPSEEVPVGIDEVTGLPIPIPTPIPGGEVPVGVDEVSTLPVPIPTPVPGGEVPVGVVEVSATPNALPTEPPTVGADEVIALDRKGGDLPVGIGIEEASSTDADFLVEIVEEIHVEEVLLEDVEIESVAWTEPTIDREDVAPDDEDIDDLDG